MKSWERVGLDLMFLPVVLGLPLAGAALSGHDLATYAEFPPLTSYVEHAAFSWPVFIVSALVLAALLFPLVRRLFFLPVQAGDCSSRVVARFPWWGWVGLGLGAVSWWLAWTRYIWFAPWQRHTFTPLWLAYILVVNAFTFRRTGTCFLTARPGALLLLFPLSAAFWWFFEYLNRFVQNWYYIGATSFTRGEYVLFATISFSTVLPAVMSTEELLATCRRHWGGLRALAPVRWPARPVAAAFLAVAAMCLAGLSRFPDFLFPMVWMAPLCVITALQCLAGQPTLFAPLREGDWRRIVRLAFAALICGFFWEMWNDASYAKWIYTVPFVGRFHLFEMPLLGFAGYLPFGLECAVVADLVLNRIQTGKESVHE